MKCRAVLAVAAATLGLSGYLYSRNSGSSCEIACFEFIHEGFDDAPDWLTITPTDGRALPAEEVFITNVVVEHGPETEWVSETVAWHEVDDEIQATDGIADESLRVDIEFPDVVQVLWRNENDERILDETRFFDRITP